MYKTHESKNNFEKLQMSTAINPFRGGPVEKNRSWCNNPLPPNKKPAKETCLKEKSCKRWDRKKFKQRK